MDWSAGQNFKEATTRDWAKKKDARVLFGWAIHTRLLGQNSVEINLADSSPQYKRTRERATEKSEKNKQDPRGSDVGK